ncbi:MAG: internalization competence protein, competence protein ComEC protein [Candidatus Moranbacteria bacterium GW2011_GWC1_45_18]|nr:MAG: internalization-related competence protein ComEC/Rec2 protein [Candidatus Moranbacteria bacterium GW2011_GWC2_40_12]KKT32441.1 MAG: internalization-related competence protein ComEC/Rec2 protein [Candidatus Moranbacteria bacterium GW2011_GWF2_44_10]KKT71474.1 MAG: internalization-related competence protein ComEC/Rec2 protein [Candidatus Moranbacteria bacterium GW2011_GWF1_44_4]KKT99726.1 MAG: internalization competence protein, competence protein ComEC protein [Candidatus Moranbacteria ba
MKNRISYITFAALLIILAYFSYQIFVGVGHLQVVFLDVGQGDSILIQKGTRQILIDGGPSGKTELAKLGKYLPYFDDEIELVILTHPDKDHLAGLVEVARSYKIGKVLTTGAEKDTQVYKEWKDLLAYNKFETMEVWRGAEVKFEDVRMKVIHPQGKIDASAGDANNDSIVARLDYGENSFLFTGDIESPAEKEILDSGEDIDVDFLKIAHHGSKYSSGEAFLDAASPEEAIISVSENNSYGHPTEAVLGALKKRNINIFRTDEIGDIIYTCIKSKCKNQNAK